MSEDLTRSIIALLVIGGFFAVVVVVLFGLIDVERPGLAKFVGLILGYISGVMQPIILRYFKEPVA